MDMVGTFGDIGLTPNPIVHTANKYYMNSKISDDDTINTTTYKQYNKSSPRFPESICGVGPCSSPTRRHLTRDNRM